MNPRTIVTISPSWKVENRTEYARGVATLERLGLRVINPRFPARLPSPEGKAQELHAAFANERADIILARRGGYSSMKMLPHVDFAFIKKHPRMFAGFSDLSTLLNAIYERTGQVTLHAPMVINFEQPTAFTVRSFLNAVDGFPETDLFDGAPVTVCRPGTARGTIKGGNLVTLTALIGTPWEPDFDGSIVFFEDVDEKPHEVDRYLTHWALTGKLKRIKGLILGDFRGVPNRAVFAALTACMDVTVPVVHCPYIGHVKNKITIPVGAAVALDTRARSLTLLERPAIPRSPRAEVSR